MIKDTQKKISSLNVVSTRKNGLGFFILNVFVPNVSIIIVSTS
jgi:hypothetical protein